jgi:dinuclear metal center YbgI/SA1388 family protein
MTCLTITSTTAWEAIEGRASVIVTHHPLPFKPIQRITTDTTAGRLLWDLTSHGICVYSPHTAFDSAKAGINARLAQKLQLSRIQPLIAADNELAPLGIARVGEFATPTPFADLVAKLRQQFPTASPRAVAKTDRLIMKVAVACGSAGSLLDRVIDQGCDAFVTGETSFHTCLEAEARGIALLLLGHYTSERFGIELLADDLQQAYPDLQIWPSARERDPVFVLAQ